MILPCEFHYDSAHRLPLVPPEHKCSRLHGHTYRLSVAVAGPVQDNGFIIDFAEVKEVVEPVIKQLDHYYLNDVPGLENPTVEIQLKWLWERINLPLLYELTLREGLHGSGIYRGPGEL